MPVKGPAGAGGHTKRKKRRAPASQGHPSQGRPTVGGGTKSKPKRYLSPTPSVPVQRAYKKGAPAPSRQVSKKRTRILENRRTRQEAKKDVERLLKRSVKEVRRLQKVQAERRPQLAHLEARPLTPKQKRVQTDAAKLFAPEKVVKRGERADAARRLAKAGLTDLKTVKPKKPKKPEMRTFRPPRGGPAVKLKKGKALDVGKAAGSLKDFLNSQALRRSAGPPPSRTLKRLKDPKTLVKALQLSNALRGGSSPQEMKAAGLDPSKAVKYADAPIHIARALLTDPKSRQKTLSSIPGLLAGIVPGTVSMAATAVSDPAKLGDLVKKDLKERYGEGTYKDIRRGLRKHGGVVYGLDVAAGAAGIGRAAKLGARLNPKLRPRIDEPRPRLRLAEGTPGVTREQRLSPNLFVHMAQRNLDKRRSAALKRRLLRDERRNKPVRGVLPGPGEVVKHRSLQAGTLRFRELQRKGRNVIRFEAVKETALHSYRQAVSKLNRKQKVAFAYAIEHGLPAATSPEAIAAGRAQLARTMKMIEERRAKVKLEKVPRGAADELVDLQFLHANYDKIFTPELRQFADEAAAVAEKYGISDPSFGAAAALQRRRGPQALALDRESMNVRDVELPPEPAFAQELGEAGERAQLFRQRAEQTIERINGKPKKGEEIEYQLSDGPKRTAIVVERGKDHFGGDYVIAYNPKGTIDSVVTVNPHSGRGMIGAPGISAAGKRKLASLEKGTNGKAQGWRVGEDTFPTKKAAEAHKAELTGLAERWEGEVASMGKIPPRTRNETAAEVVGRLDEQAAAAGLARGGYFPHTPSVMGRVTHADFTAGSRLHAKAGVKPTRYELAQLGVVDRSPAAFERGVAANIKRRFQWDESARAMDEYALTRATSKKGVPIRTGTLKQWDAWARKEGRDLQDYVVVNGAKFRAREGQGKGELTDADFDAVAIDGAELERIGRAVDDNPNWSDLPVSPAEYRSTRGWVLVPKAVYQEMKPQNVPKGLSVASRAVGKVVKTIPSKLILGLNPSWAVLQVINDATLAALAGVSPRTLVESERFWRTHPQALERSQPYIGATHFERELTGRGNRIGHLLESDIGAAMNGYIEAMRAAPLKIPKVGASAYKYRNPLDWLFQFTHWEADKFRRALLYKQAKREAWEQMGREFSEAMALLEPMKASFPKTTARRTEQQMIADLTKNREAMDRFGLHVDRMMGNYTRFTPWERRLLERNIMFYGFLRFSLRYALWTMPTKHPVISSIAGHLSQLHEDEARRLLGVRPDEPLLPGMLSKYYYMKDGKLQELPMQRMNPALNALTQASGLNQFVGTLPPLYQELANQIASKDLFFNQPFRLEGDPALVHKPRLLERKLGGIGSLLTPGSPRFKIAVSNLVTALAPVRTWNELTQGRSPMSSESLPWDPVPMQYTDEDIAADIELQRREDLRRPSSTVIRDTLLFPFGRESRDKEREKRYLRDLEVRDVGPLQEKLDRINKFDNDEYFNIWIDKRIKRLEKERQRKLDRALGR